MERLKRYFEKAKGCLSVERKVGLEVETMLVDEKGGPINLQQASAIYDTFVKRGWQTTVRIGEWLRKVERDGWLWKPETGWHNFELVTPGFLLRDNSWQASLIRELHFFNEIAGSVDAHPIYQSTLESKENVLVEGNMWVELDGVEALTLMAHSSSIHFTIDLVDLEEGFAIIKSVNQSSEVLHPRANLDNWQRYVDMSPYDHRGCIGPAPENFADYIRTLSGLRVAARLGPEGERIALKNSCSFAQVQEMQTDTEINTFLRSIFWTSRLRVYQGKLLCLELRNLARCPDDEIPELWEQVYEIIKPALKT